MAISLEKLKHGFVVSQILFELTGAGCKVGVGAADSRSGYVVEVEQPDGATCKFALFIKLSNKRRSPWGYSFTKTHQNEIDALKEEFGEVFILLLNHDDGVACLSYELFRKVLDNFHEPVENLTVKSSLRSQYGITGRDGGLDRKISRSDFPKSIGLYVAANNKVSSAESLDENDKGIWERLFGL